MKSSVLFVFAFFLSSIFGFSQDLKIDISKATVKFYFHGDKVDGTLSGFKGNIKFDPNNPQSASISGSVDVSTMDTKIKNRDKHLKSADFFEVEKYPKMTFNASSVKKDGEVYVVFGKLTIKDVTRDEKFKLSLSKGTVKFTSTINSADYGIMKKKNRDDSVVDITIEIPLL